VSDRDGLPLIHVVAGGLIDAAGRVLIAQRPPGKDLAGGWEFPGGKVEPGEERRTALARELREELGVEVVTACLRPLLRVRHAYPARQVLLDMWVVKQFVGEPRGLDRQALRWCPIDDLATADLLPADAPIAAALALPDELAAPETRAYAVGSPSDGRLAGAFCSSLDEAVAAAARGVQFLALRHRLIDADLERLCESVPIPVFAREIAIRRAWALGASGVNRIPG
jgi:8-oxo-dGTP diphosphatase